MHMFDYGNVYICCFHLYGDINRSSLSQLRIASLVPNKTRRDEWRHFISLSFRWDWAWPSNFTHKGNKQISLASMTDSLLDAPCKSTPRRSVLYKVWRCWLNVLFRTALFVVVLALQWVTHPGGFILVASPIVWKRAVTQNTLLLADLLKSVHSHPHLWGTIFFLQHPQWSQQGDRAVINTVQRLECTPIGMSHMHRLMYIYLQGGYVTAGVYLSSLWTK